jgi:Tannase and feruloyl esterase
MRSSAKALLCSAVLLGTGAMPAMAAPLPTCAQLGTNPAYGLVGNNQISGLTATLYPAGADVVPNPFGPPSSNATPYCRVDFTLSTVCGPAGGYRVGQCQQLKIRVGLPASIADGGSGGVQGGWNGKNRDLGGGGYAGAVGAVFSSTDRGYVGSSTDTGHAGGSGSFALNPDGTLNSGLILDFARNGIHQQHVWGVQLAQTYYGQTPARKYWMGCSTGGRQGHYQAQNFPKDFDGILGGAPAFNWDRFITAELWPQVVMNNDVHAVIPPAKLSAVTNASIAACDGQDGITDGLIQEPRACTYSATQFICTGLGGTSTDPNCLAPWEAAAVDKIWNGPKDSNGDQAWYGLERGTPLSPFGLAGPVPFPIATDHFRYWIHQNPSFDWRTLTESSFFDDMMTSIDKFEEVIGTDDPLKDFRKAGGKMITYHGLADPLIFPRGTYHYYNHVLQGNYKETQKFYRFFPYPGGGHCAGGAGPQIDQEALFSALVNWVENGVEPDFIVAKQTTPVVRTRKICMYPNGLVYNGSGSTDDESNFHCKEQKKDALIDTLAIGKPYEPDKHGQKQK